MSQGRRTEAEVTDAKFQYGMWLGLSADAKKEAEMPESQAAFARQVGVTEETICRWRSDPIVLKAKANAAKLYFGGDATVFAFMKALKEEACSRAGKPADKRLFAEIAGLVGKRETEKPEKIEFIVTRATKTP